MKWYMAKSICKIVLLDLSKTGLLNPCRNLLPKEQTKLKSMFRIHC